jgi:transcriptional regulator with XRE-family HTH domain
MHYLEYDLKLMLAVRAVRTLRGLKQVNVANDLGIDRSHYCRIENGEVPVSTGQLKQIAIVIDTTLNCLQNIADVISDVDLGSASSEEIYQSFIISSLTENHNIFTKSELLSIFSETKKMNPKLLIKDKLLNQMLRKLKKCEIPHTKVGV